MGHRVALFLPWVGSTPPAAVRSLSSSTLGLRTTMGRSKEETPMGNRQTQVPRLGPDSRQKRERTQKVSHIAPSGTPAAGADGHLAWWPLAKQSHLSGHPEFTSVSFLCTSSQNQHFLAVSYLGTGLCLHYTGFHNLSPIPYPGSLSTLLLPYPGIYTGPLMVSTFLPFPSFW